jgi:uncharacterized membrane protein
MRAHAAITVHRSREEVEQRWRNWRQRPSRLERATVRITDAPGDRGTEIHVERERSAPDVPLGEIVGKLTGGDPLAKVKDDLRRFKQQVETGEIPRSDATPEGELAERKLKQRPAQPLDAGEREEVGVG